MRGRELRRYRNVISIDWQWSRFAILDEVGVGLLRRYVDVRGERSYNPEIFAVCGLRMAFLDLLVGRITIKSLWLYFPGVTIPSWG